MTAAALAPDYFEPFEAWRVWRILREGEDYALASVVKRTVWPVRKPLVAECLKALPFLAWLRRRQPHGAPEPCCECGIYAASLDCVRRYLADSLPEAQTRVIGRVALWGSVIECERGYRATYAYPRALYVPLPLRGGARAAAGEVASGLGRYGVPVDLLPTGRLADPAFGRARSR